MTFYEWLHKLLALDATEHQLPSNLYQVLRERIKKWKNET